VVSRGGNNVSNDEITGIHRYETMFLGFTYLCANRRMEEKEADRNRRKKIKYDDGMITYSHHKKILCNFVIDTARKSGYNFVFGSAASAKFMHNT
jgi:hypothetical protein